MCVFVCINFILDVSLQSSQPAFKLEKQSVRLTGLCVRLTGLCVRLTGLCVRLNGLCARLTGLCVRLTGLCVRLTGLCVRLTGLCVTFQVYTEKTEQLIICVRSVNLDGEARVLNVCTCLTQNAQCCHYVQCVTINRYM